MTLNENLNNFISQLNVDDRLMTGLLNAVGGGNNVVNQVATAESLFLDDEWILTITKYLHSVEQVCKNPRRFIIDEHEVVVIEKAKKIGSDTVRHLASHTMNIRGIEADGSVIPSKVLTSQMAEDLAIYENRFVVTLINRLTRFIEQKYQNVEQNVNSKDVVKLKFKDECTFGKSQFAFDFGVTVRGDSKNKIMLKRNTELLSQIEMLRKRVNILRATDFYKTVNATKPVLPPIQKTNLILNDKDYSNCYKLYLFISGYTQLGYSVEVAEKQLTVDTDFFDDLSMLCALSFLTLIKNNIIREADYKKKDFGDKTVKQFKQNKNISAPELSGPDKNDKDFEINQYFFDKVRKLLSGWQENSQSESGEIDFKQLKKNFPPVFKKFYKLNDGIFNEYLKQSEISDEAVVRVTPLQKKQEEMRRQKDLLNRMRLLNSLKEKELSLALKEEARMTVKLDKIQRELDKLRAVKVDEKKRDQLKKRRMDALDKKSKTPKVEALTYADLLRRREEQKRNERMALLKEKREEFLRKKRVAAAAVDDKSGNVKIDSTKVDLPFVSASKQVRDRADDEFTKTNILSDANGNTITSSQPANSAEEKF